MKGLLSKYDFFVFDWDGTLSKSIRIFTHKVDPFWKYKQMKYKGKNINVRKIDHALVLRKGAGLEKKIFVPIADVSLLLIKPKLYENAKEVLDTLKKHRKKIGLFTNGATYRVGRELVYLGIDKYFDVIISAQDLRALKPNPLGLKIAIEMLEVKESKTLYVGDMIDDIVMARAAKAHACGIASGFDKYESLKEADPEYLFNDMKAFKNAL